MRKDPAKATFPLEDYSSDNMACSKLVPSLRLIVTDDA